VNLLCSFIGGYICDTFLGNSSQGVIEVIDGGEEIFGELLKSEIARGLNLSLGAVLEIAVVGNGS
jgi:hypothetical protein